jgi:hypothetical protein
MQFGMGGYEEKEAKTRGWHVKVSALCRLQRSSPDQSFKKKHLTSGTGDNRAREGVLIIIIIITSGIIKWSSKQQHNTTK